MASDLGSMRVRRGRLRRAATAVVLAGSLSVGGAACTPPSPQEVGGALSALFTWWVINAISAAGGCFLPCLPVPAPATTVAP